MIILPSQKAQQQAQPQQPAQQDESLLSFIPAGIPRSIAEYLAALAPGAILLFAFFILAEVAVVFIGGEFLAVSFLPVVCIMPVLAGVVSTLVLEKLRKKTLTLQRGAMVGAAAALAGSFFSMLVLIAVYLLASKAPFGSGITGIFLYVSLLAIVAMDTVLGALGGALVAKFIKEV